MSYKNRHAFYHLNTINRALKFPDEILCAMAALRIQGLELMILSKPFQTKKLAEKARSKYPDRVRRKIGIGVVRVPIQ